MIARFVPKLSRNHFRISILTTAFALALAFALQSVYAAPGINQTINFQGRLLNDDGTTVTDGSHSVVFSLYTVDAGGSNIWTETQSVTTTSGMFRVSLGSVGSLASVDFNQDTLYLGIKVGADAEMTPRLRFNAAPYAFEAKRVAGLTVTNNGGNTLNIAANKTFTVNNGLTFSGTDGTTFTFPSTGGNVCISAVGTCVASDVTDDVLNFTELSDTLSLDASTDIAIGVGLTLSTSGSGSVSFGHTGLTTFAGDVVVTGGELTLNTQTSSASTTEGTLYYDSDDDQLKVYANGKWQADRSSVTKIVAASDSQNKEKADYVADGTGDNVEIQAAIDALPAGGGSVVLLEGNYAISSTITLNKDNTKLLGQGNSTIITKSGTGNAIDIVGSSGNRATDITVSLLKVVGPSVVGTQVTGTGIQLDYSDRVTIEKVSVSGFGSVESDGAVEVMRSTACLVTESYLYSSKNGIVTGLATDASGFPWAENCTFSNNILSGNYDDGGHSQHSRYINWTNNQITGNGTSGGDSSGIDTLGDESDTIMGNIISGGGAQQKGIEVGNSTASTGNPDVGHTVSGNIIDSVSITGIIIGNRSQQITVSNNTVRDSGSHGISVGTGSTGREVVDSVIIGNITTGNTTDGIRVTGNAYRNLIKDNIALNNSNRGMSITVASTFTPAFNIVEGNRFAGNTVAQFSDAGDDNIVRFNIGTTADISFTGNAPASDMFTISNATDGVTATGIDGMQIDFATAGTTASAENAGLRINVTSNNSGATTNLYGLLIGNLSSAEANASETAIRVGTGWDKGLDIASGTITFASLNTAGGILFANASGVLGQTTAGSAGECLQSAAGGTPTWGSCGGGSITADSLDFDDFSDAMTLDASTGIALGSFNLSTSGTGGLSFGNTGANTFAGSVTIGSGGNTVAISSTGILLSGTAQPTKIITVSPEYTNATLAADGSVTTDGTLTASNGGSSNNWRNYYEWSSTQATLQDYTIMVRVTLPQDFDSWDTNAIAINYQTGTASNADNGVTFQVNEESQSTAACSQSTRQVSTSWVTTGMTCTAGTLNDGSNDWDTAGQTGIIRLKVHAKNTASALARVGDIVLRYKAKF